MSKKVFFSIYVDHCIVCWIWSITYNMQYFMWLKKHVPYELWCIAYNKSNYYIHTKYKDKYVYFKYVSQSITLYLQKIWKNMSTRTRIHHMCVSEIGLACLSLAKYVNWVAFSWANSKLNWPGETSCLFASKLKTKYTWNASRWSVWEQICVHLISGWFMVSTKIWLANTICSMRRLGLRGLEDTLLLAPLCQV